MSHKPTYKPPFRRRKKEKTNYKKRLALIKSQKPRMVVRKSNKHTIVQIMQYQAKGDKVLATAHTKELKKYGWTQPTSNTPAAYLTAYICAKKALENKITNAILDTGLNTPIHGSKIFAALKGAKDAGLNIPADEKAHPTPERITGKHINKKTEEQFQETKKNADQKYTKGEEK
jgi:large subunit ribosomal protein L18